MAKTALESSINLVSSFGEEVLRHVWRPKIYDVAFPVAQQDGSWFFKRVPRDSSVKGLTANIAFLTRLPWAWRAMSEMGYTPNGGQFDSDDMTVNLGCHAATAMLTLHALEATQGDEAKIGGLVNRQLEWMAKTMPYYMKALLWTSTGSLKAIGKAASFDGTTVTLDNAGLWHTLLADRAKLFVPGMVIQWYTGSTKNGDPCLVTGVDYDAGTVTLDYLVGAALPTVLDNDIAVPCDVGGLDTPYTTNFPGLLDCLDDDNTFQGVDRSNDANAWARAIVQSAAGQEFSHEYLAKFFRKLGNPRSAFTHPEILDRYWQHNFVSQRRFADTRAFVDGYDSIKIGMTTLFGDMDCDRDKLIVPDFGEDGLKILDHGEVEAMFGDTSWKQVAGRPFIEHTEVYWATLAGNDFRRQGLLTGLDTATHPVPMQVELVSGS